MPIKTVLRSASIKLTATAPATYFDSQDVFCVEMADMINTVADDIAAYHDWQALVKVSSFTGDGVTDEFDMPADYSRQMLTTSIRRSQDWAWGYAQAASVDDFLTFQQMNFNSLPGVWCIYGNKLHVYPAPATGDVARMTYISKNWALSDTLTPKSAFTSDNDEFVLPDEPLMLGLVWRYRENKGLAGAGDEEAFIKAIDEKAGKDSGAFVIRRNSRNIFAGTYLAYPHPLGPGAY